MSKHNVSDARRSSIATIPIFSIVLVAAAASFPFATYAVRIEPFGLTHGVGVSALFLSCSYLLLAITATIGYVLVERSDLFRDVRSEHVDTYTSVSDIPILRHFIFREMIR